MIVNVSLRKVTVLQVWVMPHAVPLYMTTCRATIFAVQMGEEIAAVWTAAAVADFAVGAVMIVALVYEVVVATLRHADAVAAAHAVTLALLRAHVAVSAVARMPFFARGHRRDNVLWQSAHAVPKSYHLHHWS